MIDQRQLGAAVLLQAMRDAAFGRHENVRRAAAAWLLADSNPDRISGALRLAWRIRRWWRRPGGRSLLGLPWDYGTKMKPPESL